MILRPFNESFTFCILEKVQVLRWGLIIRVYKIWPTCRLHVPNGRPKWAARRLHVIKGCAKVSKSSILTWTRVSVCSTQKTEVFPWWYDIAVKIFPVLLINSNPLVKKNSRFQYRAPPMFTTYDLLWFYAHLMNRSHSAFWKKLQF